MSKKNRNPAPRAKGFGSNLESIPTILAKLEALVERQQLAAALELIQSLEERYPNHPDALEGLANTYYELGDTIRYEWACSRLVAVAPNSVNAAIGLAGAYLTNYRPALAMGAFRSFVETWPDHERAPDAREVVAELETKLGPYLAEMGLEGPEAISVAALHEKAISLLDWGQYQEARAVAEEVLARCPQMDGAHHNISLSYWLDGDTQQAIAICERFLAENPENYNALGNLIRFLFLSGNPEAAKQRAEQFKSLKVEKINLFVKQAESFSYLGDDEGVLAAFAAAETSGRLDLAPPLLFHLAAVAQMRLGRQAEAKALWEQALDLSDSFSLAEQNLNDLRQIISDRYGAFAFPLQQWVRQKTLDELRLSLAAFNPRESESPEDQTKIAQEYLSAHPEMLTLVPALLDRGSPSGRDFAFYLARHAQTPEMLAALRDFALSDRGPDAMRHEAAQVANRAGLLPAGTVRMWMQGKWRELILLGMEIHAEPTIQHSKPVKNLLGEAIENLREEEGAKAEKLLQQALKIEPDAPDLLYNLANAWDLQERHQEAKELIEQIHQRHPDYTFAAISVAQMHIKSGDLETARNLLQPILSKSRMHTVEFSLFCTAQIQFYLADRKPESASAWLNLLRQTNPNYPTIDYWEKRLSKI
ncbi:MAG TPA: tetratricopeptide repeat protein [Oscillatoriaceae cyanobacterium M33_DOE_052]|nr:tetratricopeptide repeat protein [Oscillatoriaceae cyanobacterium M33_DOE_052]